VIEIDFEKEIFVYGDKIELKHRIAEKFKPEENWVVFECVDRLLEKGYNPGNIILENTWKAGHGHSGRLDILVKRDDRSSYLMIECKTWGTEFDDELKNLKEDGGQLFTYFQQDQNADVLMLYTSELDGEEVKHKNVIIKIQDDYRQSGNVEEFYQRWNKLPKYDGVFEDWVSVYEFKSKYLLKRDLKELNQDDSKIIFDRFLEILRHNVISDKSNAFNKIFNLFLCKISDEDKDELNELDFQWKEGKDNYVTFQQRLMKIYNVGVDRHLDRDIIDIGDDDIEQQFKPVGHEYRDKFKCIINKIKLRVSNIFAFKEVYNDASFEDNAKVVKEVVELLQFYQIRYNYRQQFLSDFFELLLNTSMKQESGQFFTPIPVTRFIIKSLPFREIIDKKVNEGNEVDLLPRIIDYAAGSGHFLTEIMYDIQKHIEGLKYDRCNPHTKRNILKWQEHQFDWAGEYVYGIEKDHRLVKTVKVSCYLHGDGLAKIIQGDGLDEFSTSTEYIDLLEKTDANYPKDNRQFDIVISNPPYSIKDFKRFMDEEKAKRSFDLYDSLRDSSKEIECLFIERTKQLLKDGGVAGIILPIGILSAYSGIYVLGREIILKYFKVLAIASMGEQTFMATGTNTVILFLKRRDNFHIKNLEEWIRKVFYYSRDMTIDGIENPLRKYISHVWKGILLDDYKTLLDKSPNDRIKEHDIYKEYSRVLNQKNEAQKWEIILETERKKLLYFILALPQRIVLIKNNNKDKDRESQFLGYKISDDKKNKGMLPIQIGKTIDACTQMYDVLSYDNPKKASTYVYNAFKGNFDLEIDDSLQEYISYKNLVNMFSFDRAEFDHEISLRVKKNIVDVPEDELDKTFENLNHVRPIRDAIEVLKRKREFLLQELYEDTDKKVRLSDTELFEINIGKRVLRHETKKQGEYLIYSANVFDIFGFTNKSFLTDFSKPSVIWGISGKWMVNVIPSDMPFHPTDNCGYLRIKKPILEVKYVALCMDREGREIEFSRHKRSSIRRIKGIKIPLIEIGEQKKMISEIERIENRIKDLGSKISR